jgi:hypothetical protein
MEKKSILAIAFIPCCSGAAAVGYELVFSPGLQQAPWALEYRANNLRQPHASRHMHGRSRGRHRNQHRQAN